MMKILLVDDMDFIRFAVCEFLKFEVPGYEQTYRIIEAEDVPSALARLGEHEFDMIVSDYSMPGLSGIDLLRTVRTELMLCMPFVLQTTHDGDFFKTIASRAAALGATCTLEKSGVYGELCSLVRQLLEGTLPDAP